MRQAWASKRARSMAFLPRLRRQRAWHATLAHAWVLARAISPARRSAPHTAMHHLRVSFMVRCWLVCESTVGLAYMFMCRFAIVEVLDNISCCVAMCGFPFMAQAIQVVCGLLWAVRGRPPSPSFGLMCCGSMHQFVAGFLATSIGRLRRGSSRQKSCLRFAARPLAACFKMVAALSRGACVVSPIRQGSIGWPGGLFFSGSFAELLGHVLGCQAWAARPGSARSLCRALVAFRRDKKGVARLGSVCRHSLAHRRPARLAKRVVCVMPPAPCLRDYHCFRARSRLGL